MNIKTIRDRLKPESPVILTRQLVMNDPESKQRQEFPVGQYQAKDLPQIAYELGYVTTSVTLNEAEQPQSETKNNSKDINVKDISEISKSALIKKS